MTALAFVVVALAAFRCWKLVADDTILDRPRGWVCRRVGKADVFITCPWCSGAWLSLCVYLLWVWDEDWAIAVCIPFALSAVVGILAATLDRLTE